MNIFKLSVLLVCGAALSACAGAKTPQQVAQLFWQSVIQDDVDAVIKHSTLLDAKQYDSFSKSWGDLAAYQGKVVIEGNQASIDYRFSKPGLQQQPEREFTTYLVQRNGEWLVDYLRTGEAMRASPLDQLIGKLNKAGKQLSRQLDGAAHDLGNRMQDLSNDIRFLARRYGRELSKDVEELSEDLRNKLDELQRSIDRAQEDEKLPESDRRELKEISVDIERDKENLSQPSPDVLIESSNNFVTVQRRLAAINTQSLEKYQAKWNALSEELLSKMREKLDQLAKKH